MARIYDHVFKSFVKGFNLLLLGWTNGVSIFSVNSALKSSSKYENWYAEANELKANARTCDGKRRAWAVISKTEVAVDMLKQTPSSVINTDYVLMDT